MYSSVIAHMEWHTQWPMIYMISIDCLTSWQFSFSGATLCSVCYSFRIGPRLRKKKEKREKRSRPMLLLSAQPKFIIPSYVTSTSEFRRLERKMKPNWYALQIPCRMLNCISDKWLTKQDKLNKLTIQRMWTSRKSKNNFQTKCLNKINPIIALYCIVLCYLYARWFQLLLHNNFWRFSLCNWKL